MTLSFVVKWNLRERTDGEGAIFGTALKPVRSN